VIERVLYSADAVYNGVGLPLEDGGVVVSRGEDSQTIVAFGKLGQLRTQFQGVQEHRLGRAILPRPVNAHTHLDMSAYPFHALPYFDWIPMVVEASEHLRGLDGTKLGLKTIQESGAAAFGDIVWDPNTMDFLLEQTEIPIVAYWEVVSPNPARAEEVFKATVERLRAWRKLERPGGVRVGLTPHTPFTVSGKLMRMLADYARLEGIPLQIHVAEHPSELELFRTGRGALADSFAQFIPIPFSEVWGHQPDPEFTPVKHLAELGVLEAKPTLIHMVNVTEDDVRTVAQAGCVVVSCPRSNRNLECGTFPWALYAKYGVEVGLGTDSVASGETLDIHDEALAALAVHGEGLGLRNVMRWAVKGGYRALGLKPPVVQRGDDFSSLIVWE
jgi:aminodeoxyfutalosine deaminase